MKAHKTEHIINGTQRNLTWLAYDVTEIINYEYPRWKARNRKIVGLSKEVLEGCIVNRGHYTREPYSDTYPY